MGSQKQSGKAFEYAVLTALHNCLGAQNCILEESPAVKAASSDFNSYDDRRRSENMQAASAAAQLLLQFEPQLVLVSQGKEKAAVTLQPDKAGAAGDVRDLLIAIPTLNWEIGISAKHQHEALKHSRLSKLIDFGSKWFDHRCSTEYFAEITPVFDKLRQDQLDKLQWSQLPNKDTEVYATILTAFKRELLRLEQAHPGVVAHGLVAYLIGHKDFYKVIKLKNQTKVQAFNFNGTLNNPSRSAQPIMRLERLKLPSRIVELDFKRTETGSSTNTLEMICDAGWQLSFRLHNASSRVEPSLKFDINLVGHPKNLQAFSALWKQDGVE